MLGCALGTVFSTSGLAGKGGVVVPKGGRRSRLESKRKSSRGYRKDENSQLETQLRFWKNKKKKGRREGLNGRPVGLSIEAGDMMSKGVL